MKQLAVSLFILVLLPQTLLASNKNAFGLKLYSLPIDYGNSGIKDMGAVTGGYLYLGFGLNHAVELEYDFTEIDYVDPGADRLTQSDYSFIYTNYSLPSYILRAGTHYIDSDDISTDEGLTLFAGLGKYERYNWDFLIDGYFTRYENYSVSNQASDNPLFVFQLTPKLGFHFKPGLNTRLYVEVKANYISLSEGLDNLDEDDFYSIRQSLTCYYEKLTLSGYVWSGRQVFAVRNGGLTVFNLPEKHTGGYGASVGYMIGKTDLSIGWQSESFRDIGVEEGRNVEMTTYFISVGQGF